MLKKYSRRQFIKGAFGTLGAAGIASSMSIPRLISAEETSNERKFLFVFAQGGWDQTHLFAPLWNNRHIDMEPSSFLGEIGGIQFVDSEAKPYVRDFLQRYHNQTCFINGIGVRSLAHNTCMRLIYSGTPNTISNDWASIIAAHSQANPLMPLVVMSGPNYVSDFTSAVTRVGNNGQLGDLFEPEQFTPADLDALEDLWVQDLHNLRTSRAGMHDYLRDKTLTAEMNLQDIQDLRHEIDLQPSTDEYAENTSFKDDLNLAITLLSGNAARCVSLRHKGWMGLGYDTHAANELQVLSLNELFGDLLSVYQSIEASNPVLFENLTIVLLSEMGRFPKLDSRQGKTHWMHTSSVLIGSGVRGNQVIGAYDNDCYGQPISLETGEVSQNGDYLLPSHLGSTLLQLADIPLTEDLADYPAIQAVIR